MDRRKFMLIFGTGTSAVVPGCLSNEDDNNDLHTDVEVVWEDDTTGVVFQSDSESVIFESDAIQNLSRIRRHPENELYPEGYSFEVVLTEDASTGLQEFIKSHTGNHIALVVVYQGTAITSHESPEPIPDNISENEIEDGIDEIARVGGLSESELSDVIEELGFSLREESGNPESIEMILVDIDGHSAAHTEDWNPLEETSSENQHFVFDGSEIESVTGPHFQRVGWQIELYLNDSSASRFEDVVRNEINPDMIESFIFLVTINEELPAESHRGHYLTPSIYEDIVNGDWNKKIVIPLQNENEGLEILLELDGRKYVE